jgi:cyanophycin synthetase
MASRWEDRRVTGVIGVPGDRDDSLIVRAGRVAARGFHRLIIREDHDCRGRTRGSVAQLLCDAVRAEAPQTDCEIVLDETEALQHAVSTMQHGEVVVVFYEKLEPVRQVLEEYSAQPVQAIGALQIDSKPRNESALRKANVAGRRPPRTFSHQRRSTVSGGLI